MGAQRFPLDRSAAFTVLLQLDGDGFGKQGMRESDKTVSAFLEDWYQADSTKMWDYARQWLDRRQKAAQRAPEAHGPEIVTWILARTDSSLADHYKHELERGL